MAVSPRLELRQGQQLVMTPQLQQAIRLLQLSTLDLAAFVEEEVERNPVLERVEAGSDPVSSDEPQGPRLPISRGPGDDAELTAWIAPDSLAETRTELDSEFEDVFPDAAHVDTMAQAGDSGWASLRARDRGGSENEVNLEAVIPQSVSLRDHLHEQLNIAFSTPIDRLIGQHIIGLVDDAGYVTGDLPAIALRLGVAPALVEQVLTVLQTFDPPGVFARTLAECLALQLRERDRYDPWIAALLARLDLVAAHEFAALKRALGVDMEELMDMVAEIRALDPKPGLQFDRTPAQLLVPDVIVKPAADGGWLVELNAENLPRVLINRAYAANLPASSDKDAAKGFLLEHLQTANWLVRSLDQRARTILRVAEEIVRQQRGFLAHGVRYLRPLNLKTVADAIAMHESTVSRVTSNKFMATPRGIFVLKYFFSSAIAATNDGQDHSSESVRDRIRQLVDREEARQVLSDDRIVELLRTDGIEIARRTVAKYRDAMRIPSSVQRRREKRRPYVNGTALADPA